MPQPEPIMISLEASEKLQLQQLASGRRVEHRLVERAQIILHAAEGLNHSESARMLGLRRKTVRKWRSRYLTRREKEPEMPVAKRLHDATRTGRPDKFDAFFWVDVLFIATSDPMESGRPITQWTEREIQDEVLTQKLTTSVHHTTIGRFLKEFELHPQRAKEWMNRPDDPDFEQQATEVKELQHAAVTGELPKDEVVVSFDEKTGMQAKERIAPDELMLPGQVKRLEFEYVRHGTLVLFGLMLLHSGTIKGTMRVNRTNEVTAQVLESLFSELFHQGYKKIHVILDQLNTHWSAALVSVVATLCGLSIPLPEEIKTGTQRKAWLRLENKAIVFHFTPKHASWLNPIERWFGVLMKKLLRRGSFQSKADLEQQVLAFIKYYNEKLAHPYRFKRWQKSA